MIMLRIFKFVGLLFFLAYSFVVKAEMSEVDFKGVKINYESAEMSKAANGDLVLIYTGDGQLTIGGTVRADILAVGGGGAGGTGKSSTTNARHGNGGNGGEVVETLQVVLPSALTIKIGAGGTGSTTSNANGGGGKETTVESEDGSFAAITARGGAGGAGGNSSTAAKAGSPTQGVTNEIDGKTYGKGGAKYTTATAQSGADNTGDGGQGGRANSNATSRKGGNGGSGIVVVRLKEVIGLLRALNLQLGETVSEFRDASDQPVSFAYSDVTCKSSMDVVASAVETADGKVGVVGHLAGQTQITIITEDKTYLLDVTVNPLLTGLYRAGAYEVAVTNASEVKYVDGDLVITYLDTTAATEKSFTLPQETTGRLLAVGGGGAGGQEPSARNDTYGLPGGGGAGGLIIADNQAFDAETYTVAIGAGGVAPRTKPTSATAGENGAATTVKVGGAPMLTANGGGGGGARSVGKPGGSGGGGSYSGGAKNGGTASQSDGFANDGGKGEYKKFGAGGGGAGGPGDPTTNDTVDGSGAGGAGRKCDITGENLEYARGGAGGVPRLWTHYWDDANGVRHYFTISISSGKTTYTYAKTGDKVGSNKYFWCEASDGKPGRDGYGDGGGGGSYYSTDYGPTFAGSGGNGAVIVRIPPYKMTVEDALKGAFAEQPVTVSGGTVTLTGDVTGPVAIPDNLGAVTIKLDGYTITGTDGSEGDDITPGGDGRPALKIVPHEYDCNSGVTVLSVTGTGSLKGGNGGKGYPGGAGAAAVAADGFTVNVADGIAVTAGTTGESYVQHPHKWAYTVEDGKIVATCVADGDCSYKTRKPFVAISASDASYTALRYNKAELVNGITPVTGVVIAPETYVGQEGTPTIYPESATPPTEQGAYTISMKLDDMTISSNFTITEPKPSQDSVYQAWKSAERRGRDVRIYLSATFAGGKAINDGNVLFLGSRCSAHSMAPNTVEQSVNALAKYSNVRWYAYGSSDPEKNLVNRLTRKGETVSETVTLIGANHFVHKEMMDDLYAELVEKKNIDTGYDLIIIEFDGDLLCRDGAPPYELVYELPEGWDDEKAARLRAAMSRYYEEDRVVWIVPDVNRPKDDAGYTGEYPWMSNPEFIWQRAFLNATETAGYRCPLQKNYEDANSLVAYLQDTLVGHLFSNAIIKDRLAEGLSITKVTPEMRSTNGVWRAFEGGPTVYSYVDPRSKKPVTAKVDQPNDKDVTVTFDMREEQVWAYANNLVIGDDFRVVIDAALDGFFDDVAEGGEKATNDGDATFTFTDPNLDEDDENYKIVIPKDSPTIKNVKLTPDYTSEDVVRIYDGKGTNIVVKPIAPTPDEALIRYSFDEHGTYTETLALTNVCDKTKVWFEITDNNGEFNTATNFAMVTILPRVVVEQAEDATKSYDGTSLTQPAHSNVLSLAIIEAEKMYPRRGASAAGFVPGEGFANVPMTADSQQTEVGSHANTIDKNAVTVNAKTDKNNYVFIYLPGTLTVTPSLPMGIQAFPVEKFYDAEPTNITWVVTNATGGVISDAVTFLREKNTEPWIPAADFTLYVDTTNVTVEVKAEKAGFDPVEAEATVLVKPRPVTLIAASDSKVYDGLPLTTNGFTVATDTVTPGYGFVKDEGVASVTMTGDSTITLPGSQPNVIATTVAEDGTKLDRNYIVSTEPGTLTVTAATMGIEAFPVEKFYDAEGTNITYVVTNATGGVISDAVIFLREKNTEPWIPVADFTLYVDTTNVTVEVKAEKAGFDPVEAEATVLVNPRPVTLIAASDSKVYDGLPLTTNGFTVATDTTTPGYGFVNDEGIASVTMTDDSTVTLPDTVPNVIASETAKPNTKLERNYVVSTEPGTLTVTPATFTASAESVEKFYDSTPTNIIVTVSGIPSGVTPTYEYSYSETEGYVPAADFTGPTNVSESATVWCRVIIPGTTNVVSATATIRPRIVVSHAEDGEWAFNGAEHKQPDYYEDTDDEAERSKAKWGTDEPLSDSTGFVEGEGYAADLVMTDASRITDPGTKPNVIDTAADKTALKPNTKAENYELYYLDGELTVTAAAMGIAAFPVEKFYDAEPTNITWVVTNATGAAIADATITLREKGTDEWVPAAEFVQYVDTTNVIVQVRAEKTGYTSVETEATLLVKPRPVTLVAGSDSKVYDGTPLTNWTFTVKNDTTTPGYGFVKEEGVASVTMTDDSTITQPGVTNNVIATTVAKEGTKIERNYIVSTDPGTLTVTPASFTAIATPYDEFYDGQEHTIEVEVQKPEGAGAETITYSYEEGGTYLPIEDFEQLKDVTAGGPVTVYAKVEIEGYATVTVSSTVNIKPRIVVEQAESAEKIFDGTPLMQPNHFEDADAETEKSKAKWGTTEAPPNSTGFIAGEGFADVPMTSGSAITEPGVADNVIDAAAVTLLDGTKPGNYIFFYLPGELTIIQRQEEVKRDEDFEKLPEETKEAVKEADKKIEEALNKLVENDPKAGEEPYIKYQLTVTPTNHLDEATRTTPDEAAAAAKEQIEKFKKEVPDAKIDKVEFVDIVLERTYSKKEAEATAVGDYNKDNWEPLDKAEDHGNKLLEVTIPIEVPEGMELVGVTRSCGSRGTEILLPKDPNDPNAEGFVYDSETKTVTLYAKDFCVFGFMMENIERSSCEGICSWVDLNGVGHKFDLDDATIVYDFEANVKTTGVKMGKTGKEKYTVYCGRSDCGDHFEWWWEKAGYRSNDSAKSAVKKMNNDEKALLAEQLGFDPLTGRIDYDKRDPKGKWCYSFKFYATIPAQCYRVASSRKIKATYRFGGCCGDFANGHFTDISNPISARLPDLQVWKFFRFGGVTLAKANKVEISALIGGDQKSSPIKLIIGGQGEVTALKDANKRVSEGVKSVSGVIIGTMPGDSCENCCDYELPAKFFDCYGHLHDTDDSSRNETVVFGTFKMKYNAKRSVFSKTL